MTAFQAVRLGARYAVMLDASQGPRNDAEGPERPPEGSLLRPPEGVSAAHRCVGIAVATLPTRRTQKDDHTCYPPVKVGTRLSP